MLVPTHSVTVYTLLLVLHYVARLLCPKNFDCKITSYRFQLLGLSKYFLPRLFTEIKTDLIPLNFKYEFIYEEMVFDC